IADLPLDIPRVVVNLGRGFFLVLGSDCHASPVSSNNELACSVLLFLVFRCDRQAGAPRKKSTCSGARHVGFRFCGASRLCQLTWTISLGCSWLLSQADEAPVV
ncbi:MAG: hypothetical protein OXG78_16470, partial [Chloroflexi bacterium]|nr:hypothetical protein [Chloroflexota bacterium]